MKLTDSIKAIVCDRVPEMTNEEIERGLGMYAAADAKLMADEAISYTHEQLKKEAQKRGLAV